MQRYLLYHYLEVTFNPRRMFHMVAYTTITNDDCENREVSMMVFYKLQFNIH